MKLAAVYHFEYWNWKNHVLDSGREVMVVASLMFWEICLDRGFDWCETGNVVTWNGYYFGNVSNTWETIKFILEIANLEK